MNLSQARIINLAMTFVGAAVFASLFIYISLAPKDFDERTRAYAIAQVEGSVDEQLAGIANSDTAHRVSEFAGRVSERLQSRVDRMNESLDSGIDIFIADILAAACKLDCERRDEAYEAVRRFYESSILRHSIALERIQSLVERQYDDVMEELRTDLRIFSGSNALALTFAFLLSIFRGRAAAHLLPISIALTIATILAIAWYVLGQDWVTTVLFSSYWGWTYSTVLAVVAVLMIDIAANKARVTSFVFNWFGGGVTFSPC